MLNDKQMLLLFSHELTSEQVVDAQKSLGIQKFIPLPDNLKPTWRNMPPEVPDLGPILKDYKQWVKATARIGDYILIQGDFGTVYQMVKFCLQRRLIPVYSTTYRKSEEQLLPDGSVKTTKIFVHKIFRRYQN